MECKFVNVYDINLNRVGVLYTWVSMLWIEGYNTMGSFQLELQRTDTVAELITKNRYCGIAESDTLMFIESIEYEDNTLIASGFPATVILTHRVSDAVVGDGDAETIMRSLVSNMSSWPCVELGDFAGIGVDYESQISDKSVEEYLELIGEDCDIGFKFVHDKEKKKLKFVCYKPDENPNAKYSTLYGNIGNIYYTLSDTEYKNVAMVAGAGEGDERVTVWAGDTSATGENRRELYVDARNEQPEEEESEADYKKRLIAYGEEKLLEQLQVESVEFDIDNDAALGDIALVRLQEIGTRLHTRIKTTTIQSENNGTTKSVTVGTPFNLTKEA